MSGKTSDQLKADRPYATRCGVTFQVIPMGPYDTETPLQIVCFPDIHYNRTVIEGGGTHVLDQHLGGAVGKLRESDIFRGLFLETLQLIPIDGQIKAQRLLLIGLGDPARIDDESLRGVGRLVINEAYKQDVASCMFSPNIKDAGITGLSTERVTRSIVLGMVQALESAQTLRGLRLLGAHALKDVTLLSGPKFLDDTWKTASEALTE